MISFPDKKYNIVYADPPWQYNESWGNGQVGYDTMTNDDICKLPVRDILEDQAHLYLWVTNPFIAEGLALAGMVVFLGFLFLIELIDLFFIRPIFRLFIKKKRRRRK